jgi:hypothetical protein
MTRAPHSSAIDRLETISHDDKARLKAVFALWGDGSAAGRKESDGTITFGRINKAFLDDIGLSLFTGARIGIFSYNEEREDGGRALVKLPINQQTMRPEKAMPRLL